MTIASITPTLLTDEQTMMPLLRALAAEQLYTLMGWANRVQREAVENQLAPMLRGEIARSYADGTADTASPAVKVECVTCQDDDNGTYWSDDVYVHHADGTVTELDAAGTDVGEALRDLSSLDQPLHNSNLFIDLINGSVTVSGRNAL